MKISVIVPVFNAAPYLPRCLDSLLAQTQKDLEIIAVDDGSTDDSLLVLSKYAAQYKQIHIVRHGQNRGQGIARDSGIAIATGEYVGFVDSDDWVDPEMYETMYSASQENQADIVVCGSRFQKEHHRRLIPQPYLFFAEPVIAPAAAYLPNFFNNFDPPLPDAPPFIGVYEWNKLVRRELIVQNRLHHLSGKYGEDSYMVLAELLLANRVCCITEVFYNYFQENTAAKPQKISLERLESEIRIWRKLGDLLRDANRMTSTLEQRYRLFVERMLFGNAVLFFHGYSCIHNSRRAQQLAGLLKKYDLSSLAESTHPRSQPLMKMLRTYNRLGAFIPAWLCFRLQVFKYRYLPFSRKELLRRIFSPNTHS